MLRDADIAVIGTGCRFPDANNPIEFWNNMNSGMVSMREIPEAEMVGAGLS